MGGKGSGGHNKKSIHEHIRNGTYRPSVHGPLPNDLKRGLVKVKERYQTQRTAKPAPVKAKVQIPECPDYLNEYAKAEWPRVCQQLQEKGLLENAFVSAIEGYCEAYGRWRKASKVINDSGFDYDFLEGLDLKLKKRVRPEVAIVKDALNQMKAFLNDLGLTPKNVVVTPSGEGKSEMDKFLDDQAKRF